MNIAYASDDNFVDVMLVSIMSFNDHNSDATIYILDCGITEQNKQKILELCSGKNAVLFVDAKKKLDSLNVELNLDRGSIASYARLFIGSLLPSEIDRVIYLDSDTLVRQSLSELFEADLAQFTIGGVRDSFSLMNKKVFGIKKGELLINAGVLLIDLDKWRKRKIEDEVLRILYEKKSVFQGDQGVINSIFQGGVYEIPLTYDVMTYLYDFSYTEMVLYRRPDCYFTECEVKEWISNPHIIHFTSSFLSERPWNSNNNLSHPYYREWKEYYLRVAGKNNVKRKKRLKKNTVLLWGVGIVHAYLRPLLYFMRRNSN